MFAPELIAFANSYIIFILILGLTGPDSLLRPAGLPLIFVNVYSAVFRPSMIRLKAPHISNMLGGLIFGMALEYLDTVLLSAWTYETNGPTSSRGGQKPSIALQQKSRAAHGIQHRFWWAASHIFNYRFIGTPWEVPNVPAFSKSDPDYVPSKRQFLWSSLCAVMLSLFLLDCTSLMSAPPEEIGVLFSKEREGFFSRLGSVTVEEVPTRLITIFMASLCIYLLFQVIYCTTAFIMVGLRLSDLRTWRPLYGSVGDAWSLRSFWGSFWHQGLRQKLAAPARFITYNLLSLPRGNAISRLVYVLLTFCVSGLLHTAGDLALGLPLTESGAFQFYAVQTLGIVIETLVETLYYAITGTPETNRATSTWKKVIGLIWVAMWMGWCGPVYTFPVPRNTDGRSVLPFSFIQMARQLISTSG